MIYHSERCHPEIIPFFSIKYDWRLNQVRWEISLQAILASLLVAKNNNVITMADVMHQAHVAPITNGSRKVR